MNPEKLDAVQTIVVHDSCPDGTASAILLKDAYFPRSDIKMVFVQYGTDAYKMLAAEPGMLFCDICPPFDRAHEFIEAGALVLDHHKTAKSTVLRFGENAVFADETLEPGVCGAVLAYRHVWKPRRGDLAIQDQFAQRFATLAGIRDTWQRHDPRWREACEQSNVLRFIPNETWLSKNLTEIASGWDKDYAWLGRLLEAKNESSVQHIIEKGWKHVSDHGTRVLMIPSTHLTSDTAEKLGEEYDIIVGFAYTCEEGTKCSLVFSTRSHTTFDCSALAKFYGGGGHTKAAGFALNLLVPLTEKGDHTAVNPYTTFVGLLQKYEALGG